tara:strand:+ start:6534 stop:7082 length:549 start_codon:yes stop_codon:yes gene_type:complete
MLKYTALITGGTISAPFATAFLSGCSRPEEFGTVTDLHFFTPEEFEWISLLADTILPRTDSPSATDVNVHYTIDSMIGLVFDEDFKNQFRSQWAELENYLNRQNFTELESSAREILLSELERNRENDLSEARQVFKEIKQQTIAYYLTTEEVGKNHLNYLPIPGEYKPCISQEDVNHKAWAI